MIGMYNLDGSSIFDGVFFSGDYPMDNECLSVFRIRNGGCTYNMKIFSDESIYVNNATSILNAINILYQSLIATDYISSSGSTSLYTNLFQKHTLVINNTQTITLPATATCYNGLTYTFLKITDTSGTLTINSSETNIFLCDTGETVSSATNTTAKRQKITVTYVSNISKWILMSEDFTVF